MQANFPIRPLAAAALLLAAHGAQAQGYTLEGAVIDSRNAQNLGIVSERGDINTLFRAQKAMTYGILRSAGIDIAQLPPEVRARIERFATNNLEAFRAFSQGLDLKDQGKFVEAKEFFRRAAELDPNFTLAVEQQRSMPEVNLGVGVQTRAVIAAAASTAVDRGKASVPVDAARAVAALASGQSVVLLPASSNEARIQSAVDTYTVNAPGSAGSNGLRLGAGLSYAVLLAPGVPVNLAFATEWRGGNYGVASDGSLEQLGSRTGDFVALRNGASVAAAAGSPKILADGSPVYWGSWISQGNNGATITQPGTGQPGPVVGQVDYMQGTATLRMPTAETVVYTPSGGFLKDASGSIAVNFATRNVELRNLGFGIGDLSFAGLNGAARYAETSAAGTFTGSYSSGTCTGCPAFAPASSVFGGTFVGVKADGLIFSTILVTGSPSGAAGVHLFTPPPR